MNQPELIGDCDRQITANVIQLGPIDTDMNPADDPFGETLTAMTTIKR